MAWQFGNDNFGINIFNLVGAWSSKNGFYKLMLCLALILALFNLLFILSLLVDLVKPRMQIGNSV